MTTELARNEIVVIYRRLLEAWNQRDAEAFAALFTPAGSCVGFDGSQMNGRRQIAAELSAVFANHQSAAYVAKVREVRSLNGSCALLRAVAGMVPPGKKELNPAVNAIQSLLVVRDGDWPRVALLQNTPAAFHGRPQLGEQLTAELTEVLRAGKLIDQA
jgi:uncharacterized protein (TIGR02246 family)